MKSIGEMTSWLNKKAMDADCKRSAPETPDEDRKLLEEELDMAIAIRDKLEKMAADIHHKTTDLEEASSRMIKLRGEKAELSHEITRLKVIEDAHVRVLEKLVDMV